MSVRIFPLLSLSLFLLASVLSFSQETAVEPSTEKAFPVSVTVSSGGKEHVLSLTGLAVRKKFVFKVYGMAHYIEDPQPGTTKDLLKAMAADGKAKQITMNFAREVSPEQIRGAYSEGFKENATAEELPSLKPSVDAFLGYFEAPVKENDTFILRWLPGGRIAVIIGGKEKTEIVDRRFAEVLWSIWFGEDSIVDREDLVGRIAR
jgi:Chalcone isomerase-like